MIVLAMVRRTIATAGWMQEARMRTKSAKVICALSVFIATLAPALAADNLKLIDTVVVIYGENRSFDNLYGNFPGANGVAKAPQSARIQRDRNGKPLRELPPIWEGLTGKGVTPPVTQAETEHLPNAPFAADDPKGFDQPLYTATRDLWHRFYQNQMQINGGKNNMFAAWADSGGLVMSHYDGSGMAMWKVAQRYTLADNFFMGGFGGSFFNHQWLICACAPRFPEAPDSMRVRLDPDGKLTKKPGSPSAKDGAVEVYSEVHLGQLGPVTPDGFVVNSAQPSYQPSGV